MSEHRPTPYRLGKLHAWYGRRIEGNDSDFVIANALAQEEGDEGDKTAEFIVRACNSHDELLKVRDIAIDIEACLRSGAPVPEFMQFAFSDAITATLAAKAERGES